jgi:hypothetical protein
MPNVKLVHYTTRQRRYVYLEMGRLAIQCSFWVKRQAPRKTREAKSSLGERVNISGNSYEEWISNLMDSG